MARIWSSGFESNSTNTGVEFDNFSASGSISTTTVRSGTYSGRMNTTTTTGQIRKNLFVSNQTIVGYGRVYINIATLPSANTEIIQWINAAGSNMARLRLTTTGTLVLLNSSSTTVGSASSALSTNTWYMIETKMDATTSPGAIEAKLNGVSFASGANDVQGSWTRIDHGVLQTATCDIFFDDIAVNDASGSFQNTYPGSGKILHLLPDSAGDSNGFLVNVGGTAGAANNYTRVNEVTPNDSSSYNASVVLNAEDLFNNGASGIGSSDTVNVVAISGRFANIIADATSAVKFEVEKTTAGTKAQSAAIIPNSTTWRTGSNVSPFLYPLTTYQDPDAGNWTQTTLDSMQIGYTMSAAGVNTVAVSTVWALVDYTPSMATNITFITYRPPWRS